VTVVLPLKDSSRDLIVEVARSLQSYFPDILAEWREGLAVQHRLEPRVIAGLERITIATGCSYFCHGDFEGFTENLVYFSTRLAKLQVDTQIVLGALESFNEMCEPYLASIFGDRLPEALAGLEMFSSATFMSASSAFYHVRSKESSALLRILEAELYHINLTSMLQKMLEITCDVFSANVGAVLLRDAESDLVRMEACLGIPEWKRGEYNVQLGQGIAGRIARTGEPEMVMDAGRDPRVLSLELKEKAKSLWAVPLKLEGNVTGVIVIGFPKLYDWLPTERELLHAIADRSALAVHRARMNQILCEREARIAQLSAHMLNLQEEERKRISRELHDETGQALMVIRLYLGMLESVLEKDKRVARSKVHETVEVVDRTIDGLRRIIGKLSPLVLQELGLFAAIRKEAKYLEKNRGIRTRVAISDDVGRLQGETETTIYRIVQEALHNIVKHANASNVNISMDKIDGKVHLVVEDDGVGIFPKSNFRGNSFGLAGIKERVGMLGGEVRIISMKGKGTRIEITVPATEPSERAAEFEREREAAFVATAGSTRMEGGKHAED
jgi:signal transduction histidine kinase